MGNLSTVVEQSIDSQPELPVTLLPNQLALSVELSVFTNELNHLSKTVSYRGGKFKKGKVGTLAVGSYEKRTVGSLAELDTLLSSLDISQAMAYGVAAVDAAPIRTIATVSETPGAIARSKANFFWRGPGVFMIDYDPAPGAPAVSPEDLHKSIVEAMPELASVAMLWRPSASSCIWSKKTGEEVSGVTGQRLYFFVDNAAQIPDVGDLLFKRLWLAGHGHIFITKSGTMLPRTLVDSAVWQPERLDFAAGAKCKGTLERRPVASVFFPGDAVFSVTSMDDLNAKDEAQYKKLIAAAKKGSEDDQREIQDTYIESRVDAFMADHPKAEVKNVRATMRMATQNRFLTSDFTLETQQFGTVSVSDILGDRIKFHRARTKDPLEPEYHGGAFNTVIHLDGTKPHLYAFAHGGCRYDLKLQTRDIDVSSGALHEVVNAFGDILINEPDLFCNDIGVIMVDQSLSGTPQQRVANAATLILRIAANAQCHAFNAKGNRVEKDPPVNAMTAISNRKDRFGMRELSDVISAPTLRPDGTILQAPGYDEETKLLLMMDDAAPMIPAHPTKDDAVAALRVLWEPVALFDYATPLDQAVMLTGMLTAVIRKVLPTAPGMLMSGSIPGSGKTKLAQIISILAGGSTAVTAFSQEKEELRKNLSSALLSGDASILYDNVTGTISSDLLCAMLSSEHHSDRILGSKDKYTLSTRMMLLFSGNNVVIGGDLGRRIMTTYLEPQCERPWARDFKFDPVVLVQNNRMKYITAALTILRAYIVTGRPDQVETHLGSYDAWSKLPRQAAIWMDHHDPVAALLENFDCDPDTESLREIYDKWDLLYADDIVKSTELAKLVECENMDALSLSKDELALQSALRSVISGKATGVNVGRWLGYRKNRIIGDMVLVRDQTKRTWQLKTFRQD